MGGRRRRAGSWAKCRKDLLSRLFCRLVAGWWRAEKLSAAVQQLPLLDIYEQQRAGGRLVPNLQKRAHACHGQRVLYDLRLSGGRVVSQDDPVQGLAVPFGPAHTHARYYLGGCFHELLGIGQRSKRTQLQTEIGKVQVLGLRRQLGQLGWRGLAARETSVRVVSVGIIAALYVNLGKTIAAGSSLAAREASVRVVSVGIIAALYIDLGKTIAAGSSLATGEAGVAVISVAIVAALYVDLGKTIAA